MPDSVGSAERANAHLILALCHEEQGKLVDAIASVQRHLERTEPAPASATETLSSVWMLAHSDRKQALHFCTNLLENSWHSRPLC